MEKTRNEKMLVNGVYVLKHGGVPIYYYNLSERLKGTDYTLMSSFFTALMDFSRVVVKAELSTLEIGDLRFFFSKHEESNLLFICITNATTSRLLIEDRMNEIIKKFFTFVDMKNCQNFESVIDSPELDKSIEKICQSHLSELEDFTRALEDIFKKEQQEGEIVAGAVFSSKGQIYFSSLSMEDVQIALKEIEIRTLAAGSGRFVKPKTIWMDDNKMFFSQAFRSRALNSYLFITLLFDSNITNLGMADFTLEKIIKKISEII
ncbi:MAG: hypothetical protein ACTSXU_14205 [Promethearchaeota archaeon]